MDLSTNDARLALAKKWAAKYGLDPFIVCAVIEQESGWNPWAMRFEPAFLSRYISSMNLEATEAQARSTSFGLMQTMGQVARERGFQGKFLTQLCDPDLGVDIGCRKLQECFAAHNGDPETSLLAYNGGGNAFYGQQVLARVAHYAHDAQGAD